MLVRILEVVAFSYLLSGVMLAPVVIVAVAMRVRIERRLVPTLIGWGAAALVFAVFVGKLVTATA